MPRSPALPVAVANALARLRTGGDIARVHVAEAKRRELAGKRRRLDDDVAGTFDVKLSSKLIQVYVGRAFKSHGVQIVENGGYVKVCSVLDYEKLTSTAHVELSVPGQGATQIGLAWSSADARTLPEWIAEVAPKAKALLEVCDGPA